MARRGKQIPLPCTVSLHVLLLTRAAPVYPLRPVHYLDYVPNLSPIPCHYLYQEENSSVSTFCIRFWKEVTLSRLPDLKVRGAL